MTDETTDPIPPEPRQASLAAMTAAADIAKWCYKRKTAALEDARQQITTVWWLLGGGVLLLLLLPRLIAWIDYVDATLPPDAVKDAEQALDLMVTNEAEMAAELEQAETDLKRFEDELAKARSELAIETGNFNRPFGDPLAVWERIGPEGLDFEINVFLTLPGGVILAAGREDTEEGSKTLILRSTDGETWDPVRPEGGGARIGGVLLALSVTPTGAILAAGREDMEEGDKTLILRSTDGETWDPVRPEGGGARIGRFLYSLSVTPTGAILAAGGEDTEEGDKTLILRSTDGQTWDPLPTGDDGARIGGELYSLAVTSTGAILATGQEDTEEGDKTLILRSTDGETWDPLPTGNDGARIGGRLYSLSVTPTGVILAAGQEDTEEGSKTLILRSTDGQTWDPTPTGDDGGRIGGFLFSLAVTPTGVILAAGWEDTEEGRKTLILRSTDGETWDAVRHEANGSRLGLLFWTILSGPDGRIYADGLDTPFVRAAPGRRDEASSALLAGNPLPDLIVPDGSAARAETVRQLTRTEEIEQERVDQQAGIVANAKASLERQQTAVGRIKAANKELESALRRTEPVRQASWIGTRLAVIALIIFLVQIVVNRYRYLQRLADFYDGRAHAFRMLATAGPEAAGAMLHEVSLPDLMAGLSPEAISFGKASEPPTQQVMAAVQAALKK